MSPRRPPGAADRPGPGGRKELGGRKEQGGRPGQASALRALLDLVVPQECAGCGRPGMAWCPRCAEACAAPVLVVPGPIPARAAAPHDGPAGRAVVAFKERSVRALAAPLGTMLARATLEVLGPARGVGPVWLVPIPARPSSRRARGGDHMRALAGRAARELRSLGVPAHRCSALRHVRASRDQVGLGRALRRANVAGTLSSGRIPPGRIVIVDDVTTTGATVAEAVRAVRAGDDRIPHAATVTWSMGPWHLASGADRD